MKHAGDGTYWYCFQHDNWSAVDSCYVSVEPRHPCDIGRARIPDRIELEPKFWIETEGGEVVEGPFDTDGDANKARVWIEQVKQPETFWIRKRYPR